MGNSFGPFMQGALKGVVVVGLLFIFGRPKRWQRIAWGHDKWWLIGLLIACIFIPAPLYYATNILGIGMATVLMYAGFLLGMFGFGWLFSREKFTRDKFTSTVLALLGLWLVFNQGSHVYHLLPLLAAFISGGAVALDVATTQKIRYNPAQSTLLTWSASIVANLPIAFLLHEKVPSIGHSIAWLYLVCFAVASLLSSWLVIKGVKLIEAGIAGILGLMEVVFGLLFGIVFFNERPAPAVYVGAICILAAAALPYISEITQVRRNRYARTN